MLQLENNSKRCIVKKGDESRRIKSQAKHPVKINVWAGISWEGATSLAIIDGNIRVDSKIFCEILHDFYLPFASSVYGGNCHLAHDNDPKHKSRFTQEWLSKNNIVCLDWPPESPDLNPIENVWHQMKEFIRNEVKPKNKDELVNGVKYFWSEKMTRVRCKKYVRHIFDVINKVIEVHGGRTA
ncbi:hypothetical protein OESDEN_22470 [Oesophagostomum dentatum]|uniref:Tc1-like transposase DDE domain-containing protein n=1 Tax=Oesophagostomum dentatum TaxID=61180 RepID=A0A0B1S3U5_OESDE|nr:hypothetical protein OESDEN_22470 [Oesophagostomum dentatum]